MYNLFYILLNSIAKIGNSFFSASMPAYMKGVALKATDEDRNTTLKQVA